MKKIFSILTLGALVFAVQSCSKDYSDNFEGDYRIQDWEVLIQNLDLPSTYFDYDNPVFFGDPAEVTLGRVLFYDKNLSDAGEIACASCHKQELAFADDVALSVGVRGEETTRNSPALGQFRSFREYYQSSNPLPIFWDGRASSFHDQMIETMSNPVEMDIDINTLVEKVSNIDYYKVLFKDAYDSEAVSATRITTALDQFMKTLQNSDSKFDEQREFNNINSNFSGFSSSENRGKELFLSNDCNSCHILEGTNTISFASNGLDVNYTDSGRYNATGSNSDRGQFKVPKLRNLNLTAPYMHDGRFATIDEVLDFYSSGIQNHENLDSRLKNGNQAKRFNFSDQDKEDLKAFFSTLTDQTMPFDPKWSDPFKS